MATALPFTGGQSKLNNVDLGGQVAGDLQPNGLLPVCSKFLLKTYLATSIHTAETYFYKDTVLLFPILLLKRCNK